jgi:hypothetical protein
MVVTVGSVLVVGVNNCFGVAVCIKGVTEFLEFVAEFPVVINLAVENYPGSVVLVVDRLLSTLYVNYRQAAHTKADRAIDVEAIVIWPTMSDGRAHSPYDVSINV